MLKATSAQSRSRIDVLTKHVQASLSYQTHIDYDRLKKTSPALTSSAHDSAEDSIKLTELRQSVERQSKRWSGVQSVANRNLSPSQQVTNRSSKQTAALAINHQVIEPARVYDQDKVSKTSILIVGGGPAGLSAALAAKRAGCLDVMIVESAGYFGGTITKTGMETLGWYRYPGTKESYGIGRELENRAISMGGAGKWPFNDSPTLHGHHFKHVADELILDAKIRPLLHTHVVEAIVEDDQLKGVIVENASGRSAILAERIIDASGDAIVAYLAGAPFRKTEKQEMMGVTTVFSVEGVNKKRFLDHINKNPATYKDWNTDTWKALTTGKEDSLPSPYWSTIFEQLKASGSIPKDIDIAGSWSTISDDGVATNLNLVHMKNIDPTSAEDMTQAEMLGRKHTYHAIQALNAHVPGFENAKLSAFSSYLGVRDSRYIDSGHRLLGSHVTNEGRSTDSIGVFPEFVDGYNILMLPTTGRVFDVPYRAMLPQKVKNLIMAGRHIDVDPIAHCAMRNMMACTVTGQGAGVAAAISLRDGVSPDKVCIESVQNALREQGVSIHKEEILPAHALKA